MRHHFSLYLGGRSHHTIFSSFVVITVTVCRIPLDVTFSTLLGLRSIHHAHKHHPTCQAVPINPALLFPSRSYNHCSMNLTDYLCRVRPHISDLNHHSVLSLLEPHASSFDVLIMVWTLAAVTCVESRLYHDYDIEFNRMRWFAAHRANTAHTHTSTRVQHMTTVRMHGRNHICGARSYSPSHHML